MLNPNDILVATCHFLNIHWLFKLLGAIKFFLYLSHYWQHHPNVYLL